MPGPARSLLPAVRYTSQSDISMSEFKLAFYKMELIRLCGYVKCCEINTKYFAWYKTKYGPKLSKVATMFETVSLTPAAFSDVSDVMSPPAILLTQLGGRSYRV